MASAVSVSGITLVGQVLTGAYTYSDADGDAQGASTHRWFRGNTAISGATAATYRLVTADAGQTIKYGVTPRAATGTPNAGTEVQSVATVEISPDSAPAQVFNDYVWYYDDVGADTGWRRADNGERVTTDDHNLRIDFYTQANVFNPAIGEFVEWAIDWVVVGETATPTDGKYGLTANMPTNGFHSVSIRVANSITGLRGNWTTLNLNLID